MNVGQLFETMLGLAAHVLGQNYEVQIFDEVSGENASVNMVESKLQEAAKVPGNEWIKSSGTVRIK